MFYKCSCLLALLVTTVLGCNLSHAAVEFDSQDAVVMMSPINNQGFSIEFNGLLLMEGDYPILLSNGWHTQIRIISNNRVRVILSDENNVRIANTIASLNTSIATPFDLKVKAVDGVISIEENGMVLAADSYNTANGLSMPQYINTVSASISRHSSRFAVESIVYTDAQNNLIFSSSGEVSNWNNQLSFGAVTEFNGGGETPPVDTTPPVLTALTQIPPSINSGVPNFSFTSSENGVAEQFVSCSIPQVDVFVGTNTVEFNPSGTSCSWNASVTDEAGNTSSLQIASFVYDDQVPDPAIFSLIDIHEDRMVYDIDRANGGSVAKVPVSGNAKAGTIIEGYDAGADTWKVIAEADINNAWAGVIESTNLDGAPWQVAKVRQADRPEDVLSGTKLFSPGTVFAMLSQSEFQQTINDFHNQQYLSANTDIAVANDDALQLLRVVDDNSLAPEFIYHNIRNNDNHTAAMAALSNILNRNAPGHKFLMVDLMHSGTSRDSLMNDSDTKRRWDHLEKTVNWVRDRGSEIGILATSWWAADISKGLEFNKLYSPFYIGENWDGTTFVIGNENSNGIPVNHILWDITTTDPAEKGRGIFARSRTKLVEFGVNRFNSKEFDMLNAIDTVPGSSASKDWRAMNVDRLESQLNEFFGDPRVLSFAEPRISLARYHAIGEFDSNTGTLVDTSHPDATSVDGFPLMLKHLAVAIMKPLGFVTYETPIFTNATWSPDGSYVDIYTNALAGTYTTPRLKRGEVALNDTEKPYYTQVMGFEIKQGSDEYSPSNFEAEWVDTLTGVIRITPDTPFQNGDEVIFGRGSANLDFTSRYNPIDELNHTWMNFPILDTNILDYDGIALQKMTSPFVADSID